VFNPLSFERTDVVRVANFEVQGDFDLLDQQSGAKVPHQVVEIDGPQAPLPYAAPRFARGQFNRPERFELVFVAEGVPSVGYKTYRIVPRPAAAASSSSIVAGETTLENRFFKVRVDPRTGAVASIYDKELSRDLVDPESPHGLNQLVARWAHTQQAETAKPAGCRKGQSGPVYGSLVTTGRAAGCPQLTQEVILYDKIKRIDLANRVLKDSTPLLEIYFAFPFKMDKPDFRFEGSHSVIKPLEDQFPGSNSNYYTVQHWADVSDGRAGVTLSAVESHLLEFGGLWPCYVSQAHHGVTRPGFGRPFVRPEELSRGHIYAFVLDSNFRTNFPPLRQGDLLFRYAIASHKGTWREAAARDFGWAVANPLVPVTANGKNHGPLGSAASFCGVDRSNVFLLAFKRAEDGEGLIARLIETEGKEVTATLKLPCCTVAKAYRTNLVEENQGELAVKPHEVAVPVKAFEPVTIRLHLR